MTSSSEKYGQFYTEIKALPETYIRFPDPCSYFLISQTTRSRKKSVSYIESRSSKHWMHSLKVEEQGFGSTRSVRIIENPGCWGQTYEDFPVFYSGSISKNLDPSCTSGESHKCLTSTLVAIPVSEP